MQISYPHWRKKTHTSRFARESCLARFQTLFSPVHGWFFVRFTLQCNPAYMRGNFVVSARNCLSSKLDCVVMKRALNWMDNLRLLFTFIIAFEIWVILHFEFQFSKSIKSSTFHIFLSLNYHLRKNLSFPKCPKITRKSTQNHQTLVYEKSRGI